MLTEDTLYSDLKNMSLLQQVKCSKNDAKSGVLKRGQKLCREDWYVHVHIPRSVLGVYRQSPVKSPDINLYEKLI